MHTHILNAVTKLLIPYNPKTCVISNIKHDTVLNCSCKKLAEQYNTAAVSCRVESPKDKSHAKATVNYAETWILAALRNEHFFTFEEAAEAVRHKVDELNDRPFKTKQRQSSRRRNFFEEEKVFMKPLPLKPHEPSMWIPNVKVGYDYLVSDGINKYSVPFDLIGEKVGIRITNNTVEVFFHRNRVALHIKEKSLKKDPIVNSDHMTPEHRKYLNYNTEDFLVWAGSVDHKSGS